MPQVSIIIPVYNVAPYLRECLDSVLAQTFTDWEAICVDDGSTDDSGAILDDYAAKDERFRVIHQANAGVSAARNMALDSLSGNSLEKDGVLWFVDADDAIHPKALEWAHRAFSMWPEAASLCFSDRGCICGGRPPEVWPELAEIGAVTVLRKHESVGLREHRSGIGLLLFRRTAIGDLRFENYVMGEDVLFAESFFWKTNCWLYCKTPLYFYRIHQTSAVGKKPSPKSVRDLLEVEYKMLALLDRNRDKWEQQDMRDFLVWNRDFVWRTFRGMFFSLTHREMRPLLPLWCKVQDAQHGLLNGEVWRQVVVTVVKVTNSAILCRLLALESLMAIDRVRGLFRRCGRRLRGVCRKCLRFP